ncbi:MAG: glycosyltransferase family 2 protein [Flavobacteriales bacterium]|nr:glycosyltransferase family 2 protein [Flavobacteriales bacterium]
MSSPRVTIVIATFNYGRHLRTALDSVRAQTMLDWECIVVDDASTDDTQAILADASGTDPRIRCILNARNLGVSAARNLALAEARGTYIQFLDADDAIAPEKLARQAAFLYARDDAAIVCSDFTHFTASPDFNNPGEYRSRREAGWVGRDNH